ncbi:hypothetical protein [Pseudomonas helleri]|uniref:hypothetical protein n=1 Tax=Pseudomonas helleri TaxID=1608996 RepID=UPI00381C33EB
MTHKNGSPLGSPSLKDADDNARSLDLLVCGDSPTYMDRRGVQRRSWAGMEGEFSAEQVARKKQFDVFLNSSGFEAPIPYVAGIELIRTTQVVTYLDKEYRGKSQDLPITTTDWATDESKFKIIGDDSLRQEMADHLDPTKGAAIVGRAVRTIRSINKADGGIGELKSLHGRFDGETVHIEGFWDNSPGLGGGMFRWFAHSEAIEDHGTVFSVDELPVGRWIRQFNGECVDPTWFGALGNARDDTAALLATFATNYHVTFSAGDYRTREVIHVKKGSKITGAGGGRFTADPLRTTYIRSLSAGNILFDQSISTFNGQEDGFSILDCYLVADNCVRQNDPLVTIVDGGDSPYLMRPTITGCTFQALTAGVGVGLSLSKVFNAVITENEFREFNIHLMMQGCDLCDVHNNRFSSMYTFGILELSAATFGSQSTIQHNDMVFGVKPTSVFIKSTSRHVRIEDNYLEQGTSRSSITGFIDVSQVDVPIFGGNKVSNTAFSSIVVENNRIDGFSKVTDWVYRIEPSGNYTKISDVNTSGLPPKEPARALTIVGGYLPLGIPVTGATLCHHDISVPLQQNVSMTKFQVAPLEVVRGVISVRSNNILSLNQVSLKRNHMHREVRLAQDSLVLLPSLLDYLHLIMPPVDGLMNVWLCHGKTYKCTVVARSTVEGQAVEVLPISGVTGSGTPGEFKLARQYQQYAVNVLGQDIDILCGIALKRPAGASGNIHIQSISFEEL